MKNKFTFFYILTLSLGCSRDNESNSSESSCGKVSNVNFNASASRIMLTFSGGNNTNSYKIEYGLTGFAIGSGKSITTSNMNVEISDLIPSTTYDIYITGICSSSETSTPYKLSSVTTDRSLCTGTASVEFYQYTANEIILDFSYSANTNVYKYEMEYGLAGFIQGTGAKQTTSTGSNRITLRDLQVNKAYDFYIRAQCTEGDATPYKKYEYVTTPTCPKPFQLNSYVISGSCNYGTETRAFTWASYGNPTSYTISIVTDMDTLPQNGQTFTTSEKSIAIGHMFCLWEAFYVKSNCGNNGSEWAGPYIF